jgi:transposase
VMASRKGGRPPRPHRPMVEAMIWVLRTGAPWRDLPSAYGPWNSVYTRFSRRSQAGVIARLVEALTRERDNEGYLIDATIVRAHQDASGAAREGAPRNRALARRSVHEDPRARRRYSLRRWLVRCQCKGAGPCAPSPTPKPRERPNHPSLRSEATIWAGVDGRGAPKGRTGVDGVPTGTEST